MTAPLVRWDGKEAMENIDIARKVVSRLMMGLDPYKGSHQHIHTKVPP